MFYRTPQRRGAIRHRTNSSIVIAAIVALLATVSIGVATAAAATTETTMVPACSGINIRTGASTAHAIKATLSANATLTVVAKVSGGSWRTSCPTAKAGTAWYRVSAINGKTVQASFNVAYLYAAAGVLIRRRYRPLAAVDRGRVATHLMRLINLDREALGLKPYLIDGRLAEIARDAPFTCPTDPARTFNGRARDMADRGYFAHEVPGCFSSGTTPFRSSSRPPGLWLRGRPERVLHWNAYATTTRRPTASAAISTGRRARWGHDVRPVQGGPRPAQLHELGAASRGGAQQLPAVRLRLGGRLAGTNKTYFACLFADGGSSIP